MPENAVYVCTRIEVCGGMIESSSANPTPRSASMTGCDGEFQDVFGYPATLRTYCPGRLILTGEHIDFHGYSVVSMTISDGTAILAGRNGKPVIRIASKDPDKKEVTISLPSSWAGTKTPQWHDYVLCGWKAVMDYVGDVQIGFDMLIHERIPKSCGAGSTTSLVVASALTTWAISTNKEFDDLTRSAIFSLLGEEFAELCYISRRYLGAEGTGVDEATLTYSDLQTALDKGRDRGAGTLIVCCTGAADMLGKDTEENQRVLISRPFSTAVWSSLYLHEPEVEETSKAAVLITLENREIGHLICRAAKEMRRGLYFTAIP
ncbi:hypothetical protein Y032_0175g494 [Ancylostoma ceylanicum]|nr:hypothetical protein Y032_0175g494 [Ancylostoma ceylanicum]